jgi:phosphatidylinositol glycan class B
VLLALLGLAMALRVPIALLTVYHHADEVWQYIEPAYGLITGDWIRTWDIRLGIRSWLIPLILLPPVWLGHVLDPAGELHLILPRLAMAMLSLGSVWAGWALGLRISRRHAIVAGFVAAVWIDFAYFASRTSSDTFSVLAVLPGLALLYRFRDTGHARLAWAAGFLLGLGFIARFPLGPALAIPFLWGGRGDFRTAWPALLGGASLAVLCDVLANAAMGHAPLLWIMRNVLANVIDNRSHAFGVETAEWYLRVLVWQWQYIAIAMIPALVLGARRYPMLLLTALAVIAVHSGVGHKEYRFILLGVSLLVVIAAIGSVDLAQWWMVRRGRAVSAKVLAGVMALWLAASVQVAAVEPFSINWTVGNAPLKAFRTARNQPGLCGLATYRIRDVPFVSRAMLNRDVPVMLINSQAAMLVTTRRYNVVITPAEHISELPKDFQFRGCMTPEKPLFEEHYCVMARPGLCTERPGMLDYNTALKRMDR